jgi:hypothetical protein
MSTLRHPENGVDRERVILLQLRTALGQGFGQASRAWSRRTHSGPLKQRGSRSIEPQVIRTARATQAMTVGCGHEGKVLRQQPHRRFRLS